ncbi:type IV secretion system DNA-binding domain-containing protein, partial [Escherichia coli]
LPYIPSGSFAKAMLIEGADANASVTGNESTVPMQLRITGLVEMPNSKTYDATGCFVGLEAWGDVSSERAIVRTRNISCLKDGKTIDMPIIRIGDLPIIRDSEIQNFCLHGTVGAGKSEVIRRLANYARQRGDMVVIYDRSGEFVKSYYDPSIDKILNPLDARCAAWDLWKECLTQPDFDNTANTLIPMGTKEDPFWQGSGRTIFAEAAYLMRNDPNRSYSKLVDTLLSIKIEKLRTFLRNSPAANLVEEKIEKTAISIRAVLTNYVKAIRYLQGIEHNGDPFTIR